MTAALEGAFKASRAGDSRVEDVKAVLDLPRLEIKENEKELTPLIAGDWLAVISPSLRDLSAHASEWWQEVQEAAQSYYARWLESSPIDRLLMRPDRPGRFEVGQFVRVEQRAISLLLKAVPSQVKEDVVAMRKMSSIEIIGTILTTYQPGGLRERSALLKYLTAPEASKTVSEALKGVRRWTRWRNRAAELNVSIPDATLLIAGLDVLTSSIFTQYPEVHFRLQTFRHQYSVDHIPTQDKAVSLGQMFQAELQVLENAVPSKKAKLARIHDGSEQPNEGSEGKMGGKPETKGKGGKKGLKDSKAEGNGSTKACYHWMSKTGCKMGKACRFMHDRGMLSAATDVANRCFQCSGLGHRAAECPAGQGNAGSAAASSAGEVDKAKGKGSGKGTPKGPVIKKVEEDKPLEGEQARLLTAATQLIEQMQAKALCERPNLHRVEEGQRRTGLIDSGASTCLRQARGNEPMGLKKKVVDLAQGSIELYSTACGTLVSCEPVEAIVAMGALIRLGCRMQWVDKECVLWHPKKGRIKLDVSSGCPRVAEELALSLIEEVERHRVGAVEAALKAMRRQEELLLPEPKEAIVALTDAVIWDHEVPNRLGETALSLWPGIPRDLLQELTSWAEVDNSVLTLNRRKRRAVGKAKRVMLHLFAGDSRRTIEKLGTSKGYEVVSIGQEEDITSPQTFGYLMRIAAEGDVDVIWAAPPCGTNSLCRFIQPGPRPLRGRNNETRWGLSNLTDHEGKKVRKADELYLRMLLLMHLAREGRIRKSRTSTWNLVENPQDPEEYISRDSKLWEASRDNGGFPSFFSTPEFARSAELLKMKCYSGDQGPYGHQRTKPTTWASNKELPKLLRGPGNGEEITVEEDRGWLSASWARWAPGMIELLGSLLPLEDEGREKVAKAALDWEAHVKNGHWPPSRNCRVCIAATARQRPHRRVSNPASWVLSADTVGPFARAEDETSGQLRYILVACLVVPVDATGKPVLGPEQRQANEEKHQPHNPEGPGGSEADDEAELPVDLWDELQGPPDRDDHEAVELNQEALEACVEDAYAMSKDERECTVQGLRWKEVVFTEMMRRKTPAAVEQGLVRILTELEQLGLPVTRIHSDSGTDFVSPQMRRLVTRLNLKQTCSAPEEHNSNGRIENVVQRLKSQMRVHLHSPGADMSMWPMAARAVSASWRSQVLREMGMPVPSTVPFGTKVQVLARTWLRRHQHKSWTLRATHAMVLCPAALVKHGYVVRVGKRLSVVTRLFQGQDPPVRTVLDNKDETPMAHSIGPEARITGKSSIPDMSHVPGPSHRVRAKSPGPGRVPVALKLQPQVEEAVEDKLAQDMCLREGLELEEAVEFVLKSSYTRTASACEHDYSKGQHYLFGACKTEDGCNISRYCKRRPGMTSLLTFIARNMLPAAKFATVVLGVNTVTYPTSKANTCKSNTEVHWMPLQMPVEGGRLWTQLQKGSVVEGTPEVVMCQERSVPGQFHNSQQPVTFPATACHGTEAWDRKLPRVSLLAYTPCDVESRFSKQSEGPKPSTKGK